MEQERSKKQKVEVDKEYEELKKCLEIIPDDGDDVTINATPLSSNKMLKIFDREDLKVLWRLVKARFEKGHPQQALKNKEIVDSGCSRHMTRNKAYLADYQEISDEGFVALGSSRGKITSKGKTRTVKLDFDDVYFVNELKFNLFPISQMCDKKNSVLFTETECLVLSPNFMLLAESQVLLRILRQSNMYSFNLQNVVPSEDLACLFAKSSIDESNLWHERRESSTKPPKYCLVVTNDFSRFCWVFFLATKDETGKVLQPFITSIENQINMKVKVIRCDNGTELKNRDLDEFCGMKWIKREYRNAITPRINGVSERKNMTLIEAARTMLADSLLPISFWAEAVNTACYVLNRDLVTKTHNKTPYELLNGNHTDKNAGPQDTNGNAGTQDNVDARKEVSDQHHIVLPLWSFISSTYKSSNDKAEGDKPKDDTGSKTIVEPVNKEDQDYKDKLDRLMSQEKEANAFIPNDMLLYVDQDDSQIPDLEDTAELRNTSIFTSAYDDDLDIFTSLVQSMYAEADFNNIESSTVIKHSKDQFRAPTAQDMEILIQTCLIPLAIKTQNDSFKFVHKLKQEMHADLKYVESIKKKIDELESDNAEFSNMYDVIMQEFVSKDVMCSYLQSLSDLDALEADFNNIESSTVVSLIPTHRVHIDHPKDQILGDPQSAVQTRGMAKKSSGAHAFISYIHKQRRINHKDYENCLFSCFLSQMEPKKVAQALEYESWVKAMQDELLQFSLQKVWRLVDLPYEKKAIGTKWVYRNKKDERGIVVRNKARVVAQGHRQEEGIDYDVVFALVARIEAIKIFLAFASFMGFIVYQMDVKGAFLYDTIEEESLCDEFEALKHTRFQMSSMKELTFFLGLQVKQSEEGIFISQDKYVAEILKKFDFSSVRIASTPIETQKPLVKEKEAADVDVDLYRSMIGSLMYLIASRPDIMFTVCACARFQVTLKLSHLYAVKRIFRYLKGQPKLGLWYPRDSPFDLEAYSDSDYAGANLDRKSITGEYVATANCHGQVLWIQNQMLDYGFNFMNTKIYIDNENTIYIIRNLVYHLKTKHIEIRHHFIRDSYDKKLIQTEGNAKFHQIVDFLTSRSINHVLTIHAIVDGKTIVITKSSVRRYLLFTDDNGITYLTNAQIFENLPLMGNPPESQPTPSPAQPISKSQIPESSSSPQNTQSPRQTLKGTGFPHPRGPNFPDLSTDVEAIHKEEGDSLGEGSGSGIGCQETIGGAMAQIRPEGAPIQSNDPPLSTGNTVRSRKDMMEHAIELTDPVTQLPYDSPLSGGPTPRSDEASMILKELTDLCTTLSQKVLDLKKVKTAQAKEIASLQKRVTKLEQRQSSRISSFHPFRVEVIVEEKGSGEKGGSTAKIVSTARPDISAARPEVCTVEQKTPPTTTTLFDDEDVTIADTLVKMKSQKAKERGVAFKDTKKRDQDQIKRDAEVALKIQADLDKEVRTERERQEEASKPSLGELFTHARLKSRSFEEIQKLYTKEQKWVDAFIPIGSEEDEKRVGSKKKKAAGLSSKEKSPKKQKVNDQESVNSDKERMKYLKVVLDDDKAINYETLDVKSLIIDCESQKLGTIEADVLDLHKIIMERLLANDPEGYDLILWGDLKTLMESSEDDKI
nr:retrotransposon protein, putative, unclassified [Tanacetum cinerariifolium]